MKPQNRFRTNRAVGTKHALTYKLLKLFKPKPKMKKATKPEPFKYFQHLFIPSEIKTIKKQNTIIEKEAIEWYKKHFSASFPTNPEGKFGWGYSGRLLMFSAPEIGCYYYKFIVEMIHFEMWAGEEWKGGFEYGRKCADILINRIARLQSFQKRVL